MPKHPEDLFSMAYEDDLSTRQQQQFDKHLAGCTECVAKYQAFRGTVNLLRADPVAKMPRPVRLPAGPPIAEKSVSGLARLRGFRLRVGAGLATAAAAAAALLLVTLGGHSPLTATGPNFASHDGGQGAAPAIASPIESPLPVAAAPYGAVPASCGATHLGIGTTTLPDGFDNGVAVTDPSRPTQELHLATVGNTASANSVVLVYARLSAPAVVAASPGTSGTQRSDLYVPCVGLTTSGSAALSVPGNQAGYDLATFSPTLTASGIPLQKVTIPANLPVGTVVTIIAVVPAGNAGSSSGAELVATVTLTVR